MGPGARQWWEEGGWGVREAGDGESGRLGDGESGRLGQAQPLQQGVTAEHG